MSFVRMVKTEKILFYSLLFILIVNRLIASADDSFYRSDHTFFNAIWMARGVPPLLSFFQENSMIGGIGVLFYSFLSIPFIWLCGESYFSLKLTSIGIQVLMYITMWKFCVQYLNARIAIFASLLFVFIPGLITEYTVQAYGRHFELNLFFIVGLFLLCKSIEKKEVWYYLLVGLLCGGGVYFFPGFLFTASVIGLFLWATVKYKWTIIGYAHIWFIACIMIAIENLKHTVTWFEWRYMVNQLLHDLFPIVSSPGETTLVDYLYSCINRFTALIVHLPSMFVEDSLIQESFMDRLVSLMASPGNMFAFDKICTISQLVFRIPFYMAIIVLMWMYRTPLQKTIMNICSLTKKSILSVKEYAASFLLLHFILYIIANSIVGELVIPPLISWKYRVIIVFNIILLIALFIDTIWITINKKLALCGLIFALVPGIIFHGSLYTKDFCGGLSYQYLCFYQDSELLEIVQYQENQLPLQKEECALFSPQFSYTLGKAYCHKSPENVKDDFNYLAGGNTEKQAHLYHGYSMQSYLKAQGSARITITKIKAIEQQYWQFCYKGLGEGMIFLYQDSTDIIDSTDASERLKEIYEDHNDVIPQPYTKYFVEGIGIGLAKKFAQRYHFDNYESFIQHVALIDKKYRKDFIRGYSRVQNWNVI